MCEFDVDSFEYLFYTCSDECKEKLLDIRIGECYWTFDGDKDVVQVKATGYASCHEDWHQIIVDLVPIPQYYRLTIDARILYKTKKEALKALHKQLVNKIKKQKEELETYNKYLEHVKEELKEQT